MPEPAVRSGRDSAIPGLEAGGRRPESGLLFRRLDAGGLPSDLTVSAGAAALSDPTLSDPALPPCPAAGPVPDAARIG